MNRPACQCKSAGVACPLLGGVVIDQRILEICSGKCPAYHPCPNDLQTEEILMSLRQLSVLMKLQGSYAIHVAEIPSAKVNMARDMAKVAHKAPTGGFKIDPPPPPMPAKPPETAQAQPEQHEYPSVWQQAKNAVSAAARAAEAAVTQKPVFVTELTFKKRLEVCHTRNAGNPCEKFDTGSGRCSQCGCQTQLKLWLATEPCPLNHWPAGEMP